MWYDEESIGECGLEVAIDFRECHLLCIILELMILSAIVGTSLKSPCKLLCSSVNYSDTLPFNSGE